MKIYIDSSIKKINKIEQSPIYFGNNNVDKITLIFTNIKLNEKKWYPTLSALGPDKAPIYPRGYDTDGEKIYEDRVEYEFTLSSYNGWNLTPGKTLFYIWVNYPDTNGNECIGSFACTILASSGFYKIDNYNVNPELREYLDINFDNFMGGAPRYVDTEDNILAQTTNQGVALGIDTGNWYYWTGTEYTVGGVYQATQIPDGSITKANLSNDLKQEINGKEVVDDKVIMVRDSTIDTNYDGIDYVKNYFKTNYPDGLDNDKGKLFLFQLDVDDDYETFIAYSNALGSGITFTDLNEFWFLNSFYEEEASYELRYLGDTVYTLEDGVNSNTQNIGTLSNLQTTAKDNLVNAINEINTQNIGDLSVLETTAKDTLVNAINEINTNTDALDTKHTSLEKEVVDLKEALYGYVLDTAPVEVEEIIPHTNNGYNLVDNVRGLIDSVNGNTKKVSGTNLITYEPTTVELRDYNGNITSTITASGSIIRVDKLLSTQSIISPVIKLKTPLEANKQYTFKVFTDFTENENYVVSLCSSTGGLIYRFNKETSKIKTITPVEAIGRIAVSYAGAIDKDIKIMCVEGSEEPSEFETGATILQNVMFEGLTINGANLLNIPNGTTTTNGITWVARNGVLTINGQVQSSMNFIIIDNLNLTLPAGNYTLAIFNTTFNFNGKGGFYMGTDEWNATFRYESNRGYVSVSLAEETTINYIRFYLNAKTVLDNVVLKPMLIKGTTLPPVFHPYKEPTTYLGLDIIKSGMSDQGPIELKSARESKDRIRIYQNGDKYGVAVNVNVGEVDLGTLEWVKEKASSESLWRFYTNFQQEFLTSTGSTLPNLLCSKYDTISPNESWVGSNTGITTNTGITKQIIVYDPSYDNLEDFKQAMQGVILYYELAEPTSYPLAYPLTEEQVMPLLELGGTIEADGATTTLEMVCKLINTEATTSEVVENE